MFKLLVLRLMIILSLSASPLAYAFTNNEVADWAQKVLMNTLSVSYLTTVKEDKEAAKYFSHAAWVPMYDFFLNESNIMKAYKLTIHPRPLTTPTLVEERCFESPCWRVDQNYDVPELHLNIAFSLLITSKATYGEAPLIVQSLNMKVQHY
ncbi:hypothetical protein BN59_03638 [Legionella massiliensis]|uniref:Protein IcmL-like protein n=1 Tax=Legionella massiliensis TaxID=1034943 RepID=A0A078KY29_9GAMM|nr:hypothetical protein [Legionella massiliensis]CDZ79320.1 hypothetical protein BN59_03638 [Legionella massiliensis]CEE15058.1 hypothetical protein BN1094_03638 [Legionella massiliensis]